MEAAQGIFSFGMSMVQAPTEVRKALQQLEAKLPSARLLIDRSEWGMFKNKELDKLFLQLKYATYDAEDLLRDFEDQALRQRIEDAGRSRAGQLYSSFVNNAAHFLHGSNRRVREAQDKLDEAIKYNWRKLWARYPNLCFDGGKDGPTDADSVKIEKAKFIETVNSIIQQQSRIGLNKFSVRCSLQMDSDTLNSRICFATASKAKIIDVNLWPKGNYVGPTKQVNHSPLEALGAQDHPFIRCLFLTNVSIKPHSDICGFTKLRSLHLHCIQIIGDLSGLLLNCSSLEDLEVIGCSGVTDLNIPHQLDKLRHLLISNMRIQMVELHVPNLSHFGYKGRRAIPIVLHGCSKLQKATLNFHPTWLEEDNNKVLGHVFHGIPSVSAVKVLNVHASMHTDHPVWSSQVHTLTTRPACMFVNLRHLTYEILIFLQNVQIATAEFFSWLSIWLLRRS